MVKNDMIPRINAEKNTLEQAQATLKQLKTTYELKRKAAEADIRILKIRRDRAESAMKMAKPTPNGWPSSPRSAAWRFSSRSGSRTRWRRSRKARKSAPACRSWTSSIRTRCACARGSTRGHQRAADRAGRAGRARRLPRAALPRKGRADLPARGDVEPVEQSARVRGPHRHRGLAPEPDARSHRVARRRAGADAGGARCPARRRPSGRRAGVRQRAAGFVLRGAPGHARPKSAHEVVVASGIDAGAVVARNVARGAR